MKASTVLFALFTSIALAFPLDDAPVEDNALSVRAANCKGYYTNCGCAWAGKFEAVCSGDGGFNLMESCSLCMGRCRCKKK
ncbi:hypothetical protein GQ44DRAFT_778941 [Phaeosphaeriaceae sp. PMI808]|nr:hypothetical protein GQ44DRAFT_778941 [Phaeosphaeriaceae sp. PMI808]